MQITLSLIAIMLFSTSTLCGQSRSEADNVNYTPKIDGAVKAKVEFSLYSGDYRFNVRNSRFGVSGNASSRMTYRMQIDFSNEGKIAVLDAFVGYKVGKLQLKLGQQQYRFSSDLDRGPNSNMFANRSFLSKYLTSYYGSELVEGKTTDFVRTIGSRDIGALANYIFDLWRPLNVYLGIFNGSGTNNPEWGNTANIMGRLEFGGASGLRVATAFYSGSAPSHTTIKEMNGIATAVPADQQMTMIGFEARYINGNFFIEGEYARRYLKEERTETLSTAYIHSFYRIKLSKIKGIDNIAPIIRWDIGDNIDYFNTQLKKRETFDANRITAGINIGFGQKLMGSELRLNYEKYILTKHPSDFLSNKLLQDKFTIEVVATF